MTKAIAKQAIGIFDSGIGGLTVAKAVHQLLPQEDIIYFGDTARAPYGDKSAQTITQYAQEIAEFLLQKNCKVILIACNSATAAAYNALEQYLKQRAILVCVIEPVIRHIGKNYSAKRIGLIGTKQTINSGIFAKKIAAIDESVILETLATPLLAPLIEEGLHQKPLAKVILAEYLSRQHLQNLDALILGCTHYPLLKPLINQYFNEQVDLIDAAELTAKHLQTLLKEKNLENPSALGRIECYLSDITSAFIETAEMFFGKTVICEQWKHHD